MYTMEKNSYETIIEYSTISTINLLLYFRPTNIMYYGVVSTEYSKSINFNVTVTSILMLIDHLKTETTTH